MRAHFTNAAIRVCEGSPDPEVGKDFIAKQFLELNQAPHHIYHHFTCAIDPNNMKLVFGSVRKTLLSMRLGEAGILNTV